MRCPECGVHDHNTGAGVMIPFGEGTIYCTECDYRAATRAQYDRDMQVSGLTTKVHELIFRLDIDNISISADDRCELSLMFTTNKDGDSMMHSKVVGCFSDAISHVSSLACQGFDVGPMMMRIRPKNP